MSHPQKAHKQQWDINFILLKQIFIFGEMTTIPCFLTQQKLSKVDTSSPQRSVIFWDGKHIAKACFNKYV